MKKKLLASLLRPQEGESSKILPHAHFFKIGLGNMSKNSYLCIFVLIAVYGTYLCILIKQIHKVNVTM